MLDFTQDRVVETDGRTIETLVRRRSYPAGLIQIQADVPERVYLSGFVAQMIESDIGLIEVLSVPVRFGNTFINIDTRFRPFDLVFTPRDGFATPSTITTYRVNL